MDSLLIFKIVTAVCLLIIPFFIALVPFVLSRLKCFDKKKILVVLDILNAFSGGVLLSVGLLHLLGESHEILNETITKMILEQRNATSIVASISLDTLAVEHEEVHVYPLAFLFAALGMMFIFFLEKSLEAIHFCVTEKRKNSKATVVESKELETKVQETTDQVTPDSTTVPLPPPEAPIQDKKEEHKHDHKHDHNHDEGHHHIDVDSLNNGTKTSIALSAFILWVSLMSHSVFEGLGLGAAQSEKVWDLFIAIIAHHFIAALALGTILNEGIKNFFLSLFFIVSFCFSVPIGIVIGIFVSNPENYAFSIIQGICLSLASGAFLFISTFEVLAHFNPRRWVVFIIKTFLFCLGFGIMSMLAIWHIE